MEDFFSTSFTMFQPFLNVGIYLTQAIVEGKVHIITDAIYVVCQFGLGHPISLHELQFICNQLKPTNRITPTFPNSLYVSCQIGI